MPLSLSSSNDGRLSRLRASRSAVRCRSSLCLALMRPRRSSSSADSRFSRLRASASALRRFSRLIKLAANAGDTPANGRIPLSCSSTTEGRFFRLLATASAEAASDGLTFAASLGTMPRFTSSSRDARLCS